MDEKEIDSDTFYFAGNTIEEAEQEIREAIKFHIDGLREDGLPIPAPASVVEYLEIAA